MKTGLAIGVGVLVVGGLTCQNMRLSTDVATLQAQMDRKSGEPERPGRDLERLETRIEDLEYDVTRLRAARVVDPRAEVPPPPQEDGTPTPRPTEASPPPPLSARAHDVLEVLESYDPGVRDRLRAVIQEEQAILREQERDYRAERRDARTLRLVEALAEKTNLTTADVDFLYGQLTSERQEIRVIFRTARLEGTFGEAHGQASKLRDETDAAVAEKLTDEQYEAYETMREGQRGSWGRRRHTAKSDTKQN